MNGNVCGWDGQSEKISKVKIVGGLVGIYSQRVIVGCQEKIRSYDNRHHSILNKKEHGIIITSYYFLYIFTFILHFVSLGLAPRPLTVTQYITNLYKWSENDYNIQRNIFLIYFLMEALFLKVFTFLVNMIGPFFIDASYQDPCTTSPTPSSACISWRQIHGICIVFNKPLREFTRK